MLKALASIIAAAAVAISAAGAVAQPGAQPTANPFSIGTFQPLADPSRPFQSPLPDIGRTRATTRACAVMRDLIVPSFEAALRADKRYAEARKRLPNYAEVAGDQMHRDDAVQQMVLTRLDSDASTLLREAQVVSKALGDPRIAATVTDPQVMAERRSLQQLYEAQMTRASLLNEFVMREHVATAKRGIDDNSAFRARNAGQSSSFVTAAPVPIAQLTAPPGMPLRSGNSMADKNSLQEWGTLMATYVRANENEAAKTFYTIAQTCR
jgi:hypothetical protein